MNLVVDGVAIASIMGNTHARCRSLASCHNLLFAGPRARVNLLNSRPTVRFRLSEGEGPALN